MKRAHGQKQIVASLVAGLILVLGGFALASAKNLPTDVPNFLDPGVLAGWRSYQVGNLAGNPDLPLVMFLNTAGRGPAAVMMALDARNGTDRFSLASDPAVVIALFSDPKTMTGLYYDEGFVSKGQPSGSYAKVRHPDGASLPNLLESVAHSQRLVYM